MLAKGHDMNLPKKELTPEQRTKMLEKELADTKITL